MLTALRHLAIGIALAAGLSAPGAALAAASEPFVSPAVTARLISAENGISPETRSISAGLDIELGEGWKTYWRSPGEVGLPPEVKWDGSGNVADVAFHWPAPDRFAAFGIENFGYHDEVVFPLRVELADAGEPVALEAQVDLLVCSDICIPQSFSLSLDLPRMSGIDQPSADRIALFSARVPDDATDGTVASAEAHLDTDGEALTLRIARATPFSDPDVFPELGDGAALGEPEIRLGDEGRTLWARFPVRAGVTEALAAPRVTVTESGDRAIALSPDMVRAAPEPPFAASAPRGNDTLVSIALVAFFGGLILNVMPCVLPVLSIKLSSAMKGRSRDRMAVRRGFLAAAAGVMTFMWGLAAILFALQQAGAIVGWGLQFQNPVFLALMFVILCGFAANMMGAFEVTLPSSWQTRLASAGGRAGYAADFLTGMFGAILATPCSAPFLGTAVAFALAGSGVDIAVVFTGLGLGLAMPYLAVAAAPGLVSRMPRPGRWMIWMRAFLGLLLAGTAVWLLWVLGSVAGQGAAMSVAALAFLLVIMLSWPSMSPALRWSGVALFALLPLVAAGTLADTETRRAPADDVIPWVAFDRGEIARRVSRGEVVFVDVTADWCLTCMANKKLVLERDPVRSALDSIGTVPMQADWTRPDDAISRYLESFGRYGIPFNAVYGPEAPEGLILSELLDSASVIDALDRAGADPKVAASR